jgi:hypothetical protein
MSICDFPNIGWIIAAIGWIIALVSLIFNHRLTNIRDTRKEIRSEIDKFVSSLKLLRDAANDYYFPAKSDTNSKRMIVDIHNQITELDRFIGWLKALKGGIDLDNNFSDLFEIITGDDFESSSHISGAHYSDKCKEISLKTQETIADIENWYKKKYQH